MKTRRILIAVLLLIGAQTLMAQDNVTNIRAVQNDKMVTITYDLKTRSDGFVNRSIPPGKNRTIRWKAFQDLGYGDYPLIRFKFITQESAPTQPTIPVVADKKRMKTFATLNGSYGSSGIPMVGFTVGQYDKFGWFVTLMTGLDFD